MRTYKMASVAGLMIIAGCQPGTESGKKISANTMPNVVFIMADDMGIGDAGCYNPGSKIPTPNIDSLAAGGMVFTDAHSPSSVCSPTRYGVLTGRYCWRTSLKKFGVPTNRPLLIDTARMTVADLFKRKGYATAIIGKWHLGLGDSFPVDYSRPLKPGPLELGFDYFFGRPGSMNMAPFCFIENYHTVGSPDIPKPDSIYGTPGMMVEGWRHEDVGPTLTEKATGFIERHANDHPGQPFYLHLVTSSPHRPCRPPDFIRGKSQAGRRGDMVTEFDWTVGEVVQTLRKNKLLDNTLIIITSDNGAIPGVQPDDGASHSHIWQTYGHKSNLGYRGYKTQIWDGGNRVPFIAWWKGKIPAGTVSNELLCLTDWFATVAAVLDENYPDNAGEDSYNMLPVFLGEQLEKPIREDIVLHSMLGVASIRKGNWKLILGTDSGGETDRVFDPVDLYDDPAGQLYNLATDPVEQDNIWNQHPEKVRDLKKLLEKYEESGRSVRKGIKGGR